MKNGCETDKQGVKVHKHHHCGRLDRVELLFYTGSRLRDSAHLAGSDCPRPARPEHIPFSCSTMISIWRLRRRENDQKENG